MKLSFITQFNFEFLLPFTSCREVLGKMPEHNLNILTIYGKMLITGRFGL